MQSLEFANDELCNLQTLKCNFPKLKMIKCYDTNKKLVESGGLCNIIAHSWHNLKVLHITSESVIDFAALKEQLFCIRYR